MNMLFAPEEQLKDRTQITKAPTEVTAWTVLPPDYTAKKEPSVSDQVFVTDFMSNLNLSQLDLENKKGISPPIYSHDQLVEFAFGLKEQSLSKPEVFFGWNLHDPETGKNITQGNDLLELRSKKGISDKTIIILNPDPPDLTKDKKNKWAPYIFQFNESTNSWTQILLKDGVRPITPKEYFEHLSIESQRLMRAYKKIPYLQDTELVI